MSTLDWSDRDAEPHGKEGGPDWPRIEAERSCAEALTACVDIWTGLAQRLSMETDPAILSLRDGVQMAFELLGGRGVVWLESGGSPLMDAFCIDAQDLSPEWITAYVRAAWSTEFPELSSLQVSAISSDAPQESAPAGWQMGGVRLLLLQADPQLTSTLWRRFSGQNGLSSRLQVPSRLQIWTKDWRLSQWETLQVGDAVVLPFGLDQEIPAFWFMGIGANVGRKVKVIWVKSAVELTGEEGLESVGKADAWIPDSELTPLEDVRIPVSFELDTGTMQLSELRRMLPGQSIPLSILPGSCRVNLMSGGQCLAQGRLVQIGETLAVALERIAAVKGAS